MSNEREFFEPDAGAGRAAPEPPEREYWLRHCHGFLVDSESGEAFGVVDAVVLEPGSDRAVALLVASGWLGRHVQSIAVTDVQAISASERRLIVKDIASSPGGGLGRD